MIGDFLRAVGQLADPRFTGVLARALILTVALLVGLSFGAVWLVGFLPEAVDLPFLGEVPMPIRPLEGLALGAMVLFSAFLMFPVAAMFVNLYLDEIAGAVEARHYPELPPVRGSGFVAQLKGAAGFGLLVLVANAVALAFYLVSGPFAPFVFWSLNGYLFGREYFQLVAERRLDPAAAARLRRSHWLAVWATGTLLAVPLSIPLVNLMMPLLGVATYTHMFHRLWARDEVSARTGV